MKFGLMAADQARKNVVGANSEIKTFNKSFDL